MTTATKTGETKVTARELTEAQGGVWMHESDGGHVTVECPESYRLDRISAADIVGDDQIRLVKAE